LGDIYKEKKYMNFLATLSQQQYVISANTWSECLAYCEGTGLDITSIQLIPQAITHYNVAGTNSYQVTALDSEGSQINNIVWETDFNSLSTWLDSQGYESIRTIQQSNKTYVVV
jgi:hypothetical protein